MPANRYIVFKPPVTEIPEQVIIWYVGVRFNKETTDEAIPLWTKEARLLKRWWQDTSKHQFVFLPGSEIAGEYQIESIAQAVARDLNDKEAKKK